MEVKSDPVACVSKHPRWDRIRNYGLEVLVYRLLDNAKNSLEYIAQRGQVAA